MLEAVIRAGLVIGFAVILALATRLSGLAFFAIALTICCGLAATLWTRHFHASVRARLADPDRLRFPRRSASSVSRSARERSRSCSECLR